MVKVKRNLITKIKKNEFNRIKIEKMKIYPPSPVVRYIKIMIIWMAIQRQPGFVFLSQFYFFPYSSLTSYRRSSFSLFLAVPMRECLGKQSCMSSPFPIDILNGTFFSRNYMIEVVEESPMSKINYNNMHWTNARPSILVYASNPLYRHVFQINHYCLFVWV